MKLAIAGVLDTRGYYWLRLRCGFNELAAVLGIPSLEDERFLDVDARGSARAVHRRSRDGDEDDKRYQCVR